MGRRCTHFVPTRLYFVALAAYVKALKIPCFARQTQKNHAVVIVWLGFEPLHPHHQKTPESLMIWAFVFSKVPTDVPTILKLLFVLLKSVALW